MNISEKQLDSLIKLAQLLLMEEGKNHINETAESLLELLYEIKKSNKICSKEKSMIEEIELKNTENITVTKPINTMWTICSTINNYVG